MEKRELSRRFVRTSKWYIVFVQTYKEQTVAERLRNSLDSERYVVFVPTKDYARHSHGVVTNRRRILFDGYVFIASTVGEDECFGTIRPLIAKDESAYRILQNGDEVTNIAVSDEDKAVLVALLNDEFNIQAFEAVRDGDWVRVTDSALEGVNGTVKSVDKHKHTAVIEFMLLGKTYTEEVMLNIVEVVN